jgi:hypothetical protein
MKTLSKSRKRSTPPADLTEAAARAAARQQIINAVPEITGALIDQAKEGNYLHARMLFDFAALTAAADAASSNELSPVAKFIIDALELKPPRSLLNSGSAEVNDSPAQN